MGIYYVRKPKRTSSPPPRPVPVIFDHPINIQWYYIEVMHDQRGGGELSSGVGLVHASHPRAMYFLL